ncbi:Sialic acid-binding periplasmic protein SiaP [bioreactor metagenome]|uniref:Sialic acid-binding periplasmic protein SiaP n=1 Tax=bioreactor metagenome TaxID=1076179 RepID=A0A645CJ23_9ZZZZ
MYVDLFKLLGADPVTMNASELYTALSQGAVDGQENPADMTITQKFCEVLDYMTTWGYSCEPIILSTSMKTWESLSDVDKKIFEEAAIIACEAQIKAAKIRDDGYMKQLVDEFKIQRTDLSAEQLSAFKAKAQPIYEQYRSKMGEDLYKAFGVK